MAYWWGDAETDGRLVTPLQLFSYSPPSGFGPKKATNSREALTVLFVGLLPAALPRGEAQIRGELLPRGWSFPDGAVTLWESRDPVLALSSSGGG